ncbi:MAG: hypothetical protein Kow0020_01610 [Wenzhouxiangellaceae bacterium]
MHNTIKLVRIMLVTVLLGGLTAVAAQDTAPAAEAQRPSTYPVLAADLIRQGVPVIDVRSAEEVERDGMIEGAVHIPHTDIDALAAFLGNDKDRTAVLYCGSGRRAGLAIEALRELGYHNLVNGGGFAALSEALARQ